MSSRKIAARPTTSAQHSDALRATSYFGVVPACIAVGLLVVFWQSPNVLQVAGLVAGATGIALVGGAVTHLERLPPRFRWSPLVGSRLALTLSAMAGSLWAGIPLLLFAQSGRDEQLLVVAAMAAVMTDVRKLAYLEGAPPAYLLPIGFGAVIGFGWGAGPTGWVLVALVWLYGAMLLTDCARTRRVAAKQAEDCASIAAQNELIDGLLLDVDESTSDCLWRTDLDGYFTDVLAGARTTAGTSIKDFGSLRFQDMLANSGTASKGAMTIAAAIQARRSFRHQLVELRDSESRWLRLSGKPILDAVGNFGGYHGIASDITEMRASETRITQLANFDPLTGLANRLHFQDQASRQCADAAHDNLCRALLSIDLDGFRSVNDRVGHEGGDELLRLVAERLRKVTPPGGLIARLGSDEFAIWLVPTTPTKTDAVAKAIIDAICTPFDVQGMQVDIGVSVGIAFAPKHALDPEELLVKADLALYRAKSDIREKICVFTPVFETALIERRKLNGDLKLALARGEFELHYQPLLDVASARVVGFEALIRWHSPERGFVSPAEFIPAAEAMGLIAPIGRWVLGEACRTAASWPHDVHVAVNVSPPHVRSPEFLADVMMALKTSGLHPSRLEIEVTEGVFLERAPAALDALRTLRRKGVKIALDDFGTGYSSLNYLVEFPVDKIKIDRAFISALIDSPTNRAIVDAILGLAKKLSIRVNAEGIETKEQALALKLRRCDEMQGYLLSRPQPASDVAAMIAAVPLVFREAVPTYMDSPLAMALTAKTAAAG